METKDRKPKTFIDGTGRVWNPQLTTPVVIQACRALDITIQKIISLSINVADIIEIIWWSCQDQVKERKMSYDDFIEMLSLSTLPDALLAFTELVEGAFPGITDVAQKIGGGRGAKSPFDLGK